MFKLRFPKRGEAIIKIEEVQTISYIVILILTMIYGAVAMDSKFDELERRETAKYRTGAPPDKVAGVILLDARNNSVPDLSVDWRQWMHTVRNETNRTEIFIITSANLGWYPIGPLMLITNCTDGPFMNICRFEQGMRAILKTFPNFKWVLRVDSKTYLNSRALNDFLRELPKDFARTRLLKGAMRSVGKNTFLDWRSGWFMSRRIVYEWIDKMDKYVALSKQAKSNPEQATGPFIAKTFELNPKAIADGRFVPHTKKSDNFADMIDVDLMDPCPKTFRYFGIANSSTLLVRNAVTWHLEEPSEDRKGSMVNIPRASKWSGYYTSNVNTTLCALERTKRKRGKASSSKEI